MLVSMSELREKVIRGLECVICPNKFCGDCSYFIRNENDHDTGWCNRDAIYKDALSLLKAQERYVELLRNKGMNIKKADEAFERLRELLQEKSLGNAIYWFENQRDGLVSFAKENDNAEIEYILNEVEGAIDLLTALGLIDIAAAKEAREVFKEIDLSLMSDYHEK